MKIYHRLPFFTLCTALLVACAPTSGAPTSDQVLPTSPPPTTLPLTTIPCRVVNPPYTEQQPLASFITVEDHSLGPEGAPVSVVVYSDFQCPSCAILAESLHLVNQSMPEDIRIIFRHFPMAGQFDKTTLAVRAAEAAAFQGRFWEMHDLLFQTQPEWSGLEPGAFETWLGDEAASLGLDADQFRSDFQSEAVTSQLESALAFVTSFENPALPIIFINSNTPYTGPIDPAGLDTYVRLTLLQTRMDTACPPMVIDPGRVYSARLATEHGEIVIALFADQVPYTVNNFVYLARKGWYDNITFHRVIPGFMAQTGDPSGTGLGTPGYFIATEIVPGLTYDRAGLIGMANSGPDTNGSQFFITYAPARHLDGGYTIFGQVTTGMAALAELAAREAQPGSISPPGDLLLTVTIEEH